MKKITIFVFAALIVSLLGTFLSSIYGNSVLEKVCFFVILVLSAVCDNAQIRLASKKAKTLKEDSTRTRKEKNILFGVIIMVSGIVTLFY